MKDVIEYGDFDKLDIRVGEIVEAEAPDWSKKLLKFKVDFGEEIGMRTIFSGIKEFYDPVELIGFRSMFLINLAPKKMGEEESQGMMMMSDGQERPVLIEIEKQVALGCVVR